MIFTPTTLAPGSVLNLTPAPAGWTAIVIEDENPSEEIACPIVAWAVVTFDLDDDGKTATQIEPAFLYKGWIRHLSELHDLQADLHQVRAPITQEGTSR